MMLFCFHHIVENQVEVAVHVQFINKVIFTVKAAWNLQIVNIWEQVASL